MFNNIFMFLYRQLKSFTFKRCLATQCYQHVNDLFFINLFNKEQKCGRPLGSNFILQSDRIVSGYDVGYYRYPWYAALIQRKQVSCGGALIAPKMVLTAAHCYKEYLGPAK